MYRSPLRYHEFVSMFLSFNLHLLLCIKLLLLFLRCSYFSSPTTSSLFLLLLKITVVFSVHLFLFFALEIFLFFFMYL